MTLPTLAGAVSKTQRAVVKLIADVPARTTNQVTTMAATGGSFFNDECRMTNDESMKLENGKIKAPVVDSRFGPVLNLTGLIPDDCDCVMVLINSGSGINAGVPQPVGFMKLPGQIYVKDLEAMMELNDRNRAIPGREVSRCHDVRWITLCPVRAKEYLDIWEAEA